MTFLLIILLALLLRSLLLWARHDDFSTRRPSPWFA